MSAPATGRPSVEVTSNMMQAGVDVYRTENVDPSLNAKCARIFRAMLAAAPSPTDWPSEEAVERAARGMWECVARGTEWPDLPESGPHKTEWRFIARAALAAAPSPQVESGWRLLTAGETIRADDELFVPGESYWRLAQFADLPGHYVTDADNPIRRKLTRPPTPAEIPQQLQPIVTALARFKECADDDNDCDISREWFDTLTFLGLLIRTQRSPATWQITDAGVSLLRQLELDR